MLARYLMSSCVRLCVRLSVCRKPVWYRNDSTKRAGFWHGGFLPPIPHAQCLRYKETCVSPTITFSLELCPKLRTEKISPRQVDRVVDRTSRRCVDGRARWRHLYDNGRVVAVYWRSIHCNPLTPLLRFVVDFLYDLFLELTRFRLTCASCGPPAVAELLVLSVSPTLVAYRPPATTW